MKKIVKNIKGIKIDVRSKESLYVTMKDWTVYIDNSTNEKIINSWKEKKNEAIFSRRHGTSCSTRYS